MNRILYLFMAAIIVLISSSGCTEHSEVHKRTAEIIDNNGNVKMKEIADLNGIVDINLSVKSHAAADKAEMDEVAENNDSSPKGASYKYLYTNEVGEEEILFEIYSGQIQGSHKSLIDDMEAFKQTTLYAADETKIG